MKNKKYFKLFTILFILITLFITYKSFAQNNNALYEYQYVSSWDGTETKKDVREGGIGGVFNYILTFMTIGIVLLILYRILTGAIKKGTTDNIYQSKEGNKSIKIAGVALLLLIVSYSVLTFVNPSVKGWSLSGNIGDIVYNDKEGTINSSNICGGNSLKDITSQELIKKFEGYTACPYWDNDSYSIGYGYHFNDENLVKEFKDAGVDQTVIDKIVKEYVPATNKSLGVKDGTQSCGTTLPSITKEQASKLIPKKLERAKKDAITFAGGESVFKSHPEDMQKVLIDMAYNLGLGGLNKFEKMKKALNNKNYPDVAKEMSDSDWFNQVRSRAEKLIKIVKNITCKSSSASSYAQDTKNYNDSCKNIVRLNDTYKTELVDLNANGIKCTVTETTCYVTKEFLTTIKRVEAAYKVKFPKKEFVVVSGFRTDDMQTKLYEDNKKNGGPITAESCKISNGTSHSNHQTGNAVDLSKKTIGGCEAKLVCDSKEFKWLKDQDGFKNLFTSKNYDNIHFSKSGN